MDLRQSTAGQVVTIGHALDSTDGDTEENALTIANTDIKLHKHNTTVLANKNSGGATNISNGVYHLTFDATDSSLAGRLVAYIHVPGALAMKEEFNVLTQSAFDAKYTGTFNNLGGVAQTVDNDVLLQDIPNTSEFEARTVTSGTYATSTAQTTAQDDLDKITGTDGVTLATAQALFTPAKAGDSMDVSSIGNNVITALSIAANALDGKGNWNIGKSGYSLTGAITNLDGLENISAAQVNAEMLDVLVTDTFTEVTVPSATASIKDMIHYTFSRTKNKTTQTATTLTVRNDSDSGNLGAATVSDDGATFTKGKET